MNRVLLHILAAVVLICCVCSCSSRKRISRSEMSDIYADMLIADAWLRSNPDEFVRADTMRFYEPIFNKYGYTTEDFLTSASFYMRDPRRFARILQRSSAKLDAQFRHLDDILRSRDEVDLEIRNLMDNAPQVTILYDTAFFSYARENQLQVFQDVRGAYVPDFVPSDPDTTLVSRGKRQILPSRFKEDTEEVLPDMIIDGRVDVKPVKR